MIFDALFPATRARVHLSADKVWGKVRGELARREYDEIVNNNSALQVISCQDFAYVRLENSSKIISFDFQFSEFSKLKPLKRVV